MLSLSNVSAAQAENYYENDDYYTQGSAIAESAQFASKWVGKGAIALQLTGTVQSEVFRALLHGQDLQGNSLHAKAINADTHRAATDYTFSAPKSVSISALIQGDPRAIQAHDRAVETALSILEERYTQARISTATGRQKVMTGNLVAAVFRHETSREQDPQLHSHCVVINATQLPDGSWRSMSNDAAIAHQKLLGQIYQNELAFQLRQFGYEIERLPNGQFELRNYAAPILETFSTRTQAIQRYLEQKSQDTGQDLTAAQRKQATLQTRKNKAKAVPREVLLNEWNAQLTVQNLELPKLPVQGQDLSISGSNAALAAIHAGVAHCSERDSVFRRSQVERFALEHHLGEQSFEDLQIAFQKNSELIQTETPPERFTTQTAVDRELETIRLMQLGQGNVSAIASTSEAAQWVQYFTLTEEQQQALIYSATVTDQFIAWQGVAGAGKTYSLHRLSELATTKGYQVRGFAPSAEAAAVLEREAEIHSSTVASLLHAPNPMLQTDLPQIWIVDEAGLLSAKDAYVLLQKAHRESARVILVGDSRQLSAVEAGNPFQLLQAGGIAIAYLDQSLRQKTQVLREAVGAIAQGHIAQGIDQLQNAGRIQEIPEVSQRLQQVAQDFLQLSTAQRENTLVITGNHCDRAALTQQIRTGLQQAEQLGNDVYFVNGLRPKDLTLAQARYAWHYTVGDVLVPYQTYRKQGLEKNQHYQVVAVERNEIQLQGVSGAPFWLNPTTCDRKTIYQPQQLAIAPGERLRWTRNDRATGSRNGQTFIVDLIHADGTAQIQTEQGKTAQVDFNSLPFLDYAWVLTTYNAQGKTAERVLAMTDGMTSRESFYVMVSRAKAHITLYTANLETLRQQAQRSRANETAIPLYQQVYHAQTSQIDSIHPTTNRNHVYRGDASRSLGTRLAAPLAQDSRIGDSLSQLARCSSYDASEAESLSHAIAAVIEQRDQATVLNQLGRIIAAVDSCVKRFDCRGATHRAAIEQDASRVKSDIERSPAVAAERRRESLPNRKRDQQLAQRAPNRDSPQESQIRPVKQRKRDSGIEM